MGVFRFAVIILLAGVTAACAALTEGVQQPRVSVLNVELGNLSLDGATALFTLQVDNPNAFALAVNSLSYGLALNGFPVLNGDSDQRMEVAANGSNTVTLPVSLRYSDLLDAIPNLLRTQSVNYKLTGAVGAGIFKIPYSKVGELKLGQ